MYLNAFFHMNQLRCMSVQRSLASTLNVGCSDIKPAVKSWSTALSHAEFDPNNLCI